MTIKDIPAWPVTIPSTDPISVEISEPVEIVDPIQVEVINEDPIEVTNSEILNKDPLVVQISMPTAGSIYSVAFPEGTKKFMARIDKGEMSYRYGTSGAFFYLGKSAILESPQIDPTDNVTLYVKSTKDNDTLTVEYWS